MYLVGGNYRLNVLRNGGGKGIGWVGDDYQFKTFPSPRERARVRVQYLFYLAILRFAQNDGSKFLGHLVTCSLKHAKLVITPTNPIYLPLPPPLTLIYIWS